MRTALRAGWLMLSLAAGCAVPRTPGAAFDELLAADRAFAHASADTTVAAGLGAALAAEVMLPVPGPGFARGRAAAIEALRANPDHEGARITWRPVSGGLSADGLHGFTWGYMTLRKADRTEGALKYLAYWVKGDEGWRVVALRRGRASGPAPAVAPTPVLPAMLTEPSSDSAAIARFRESLDATEREFSDSAQRIGLRAAFAMFGRPDAINMGGPTRAGFVRGADSISVAVSSDEPATGSSVSWGPDLVIVASSGDLGVSIGMIRPNTPEPGQPSGFPFFTVWRRASVAEPWRYVAE